MVMPQMSGQHVDMTNIIPRSGQHIDVRNIIPWDTWELLTHHLTTTKVFVFVVFVVPFSREASKSKTPVFQALALTFGAAQNKNTLP